MNDESDLDAIRHSQALEAELILDLEEKAAAESRNGLRQIDAVVEIVEDYVQRKRPFRLRPSMLLHLHGYALEGLSLYAGVYRPAGIVINKSRHQPVGAFMVAEKVEELCDYVNEKWNECSPIHLAAYVLWRLNWIHPFTDGNGRTARASSYLVLCLRLGYPLYSPLSVPAQIAKNKQDYYEALEAADQADSEGRIDVRQLEGFLDALLARQLYSVLEHARRDAKT